MRGGWSRSKQEELDKLVEQIGHVKLEGFTKQTMIQYGKKISEARGPSGVQERLVRLQKVFRIAYDSWDIEAPRGPPIRLGGAA
jgi:hypothetical protein